MKNPLQLSAAMLRAIEHLQDSSSNEIKNALQDFFVASEARERLQQTLLASDPSEREQQLAAFCFEFATRIADAYSSSAMQKNLLAQAQATGDAKAGQELEGMSPSVSDESVRNLEASRQVLVAHSELLGLTEAERAGIDKLYAAQILPLEPDKIAALAIAVAALLAPHH